MNSFNSKNRISCIDSLVSPGSASVLFRPCTSNVLLGKALAVFDGDIRVIIDRASRAIKVAVADQGLWVNLYMYKNGHMSISPDYATADRLVPVDLPLLPLHVVQQATNRDPVCEEMAWEVCGLKKEMDAFALDLQIARKVVPRKQFELTLEEIAS